MLVVKDGQEMFMEKNNYWINCLNFLSIWISLKYCEFFLIIFQNGWVFANCGENISPK